MGRTDEKVTMPYFRDGNNLMHDSVLAALIAAERARSERRTRLAFLDLLSRIASSRGGRFVVYFDGDDPDRSPPPRGVRVRFSAPLASDTAIVRDIESSRFPSEIIVVTNDRTLAARCRDAGSRAMSWREFTRRAARSAPRAHGRPQEEEKIDVGEWASFFGFDPDMPD